MSKRSKWLIGILAVIFAGVNLYLIKQDELLVDRTSIVHDQKMAQSELVEEVMVKNGVVHTALEERVYFSEQLGMFTRFLVEEGDQVSPGTPLYEYTVSDLEEQRLVFESEIEQIDDEISAVESYITELDTIERQISSTTSSSSANAANATPTSSLDDEELLVTIELEVGIDVSDATVEQTRALVEQQIGQQEAQVERLEAERDKYERLADGLEDSPVVTVESEFTGQVARLAEDISHPLITIYTDSLASRSKLTDEEAKLVTEGMEARVASPVAESIGDGVVASNPLLPEQEPALDKKSMYPVNIDLLTATQDWFIGQHVVNEIVLEAAPNAVTMPVIGLDISKVYVLNAMGIVEPRIVEIGILDGDRQQILSGLEPGEWVTVDPEQIERTAMPYITPMTIERLTFDNLGYTEKRTNWKYVLLGVLPN
ncbi:efflux RND transporter periplasmic adaptor subunit [Jeotgalibacillus salarius]|uniref:Efflux RND transporter periplasmic adaptor subunit n=1 Tax=Jeotgalibacillus salarius TaxID=546023 RepID=A0A4Y8LSZ0_9BACL|nr:efflux RND transporter periplasmic adaptor subunit [Jeotgalibacillus salarius]TFE04085.1 efflux RND transporter periplasmic adaptor subunit [Jeotgalibacillus salarius]